MRGGPPPGPRGRRATGDAKATRGACRGVAEKRSMPKRAMSNRGPAVAIISIAQHASPKVAGHNEFLRKYPASCSTVNATASEERPESSRVQWQDWPVAKLSVNVAQDEGLLELWRHAIGHGGINDSPLPARVSGGLAQLHPRLIRIFIQEFFSVYPEHGRFNWARLDPYMDDRGLASR